MNETLTLSVWEDLIHNQRWEELRAKLAATHSSDTAEALVQIHGNEQALSSAFCLGTTRLRFSPISLRTGRKRCSEPYPRMN